MEDCLNLEAKAVSLKEKLDSSDILSKIESLEKSSKFFEAASLAWSNGYTDRAIDDCRRTYEMHRRLSEQEQLLGGDIYPKRHVLERDGHKIIVILKNIDFNKKKKEMIPLGEHIKIESPELNFLYNGKKGYGYYAIVLSEPMEIFLDIKEQILSEYGRDLNDKLLENLVKEALIPYKRKNY